MKSSCSMHSVKSILDISSIFVAFLEKRNFTKSSGSPQMTLLTEKCPINSVPLGNSILQFLNQHILKNKTILKNLVPRSFRCYLDIEQNSKNEWFFNANKKKILRRQKCFGTKPKHFCKVDRPESGTESMGHSVYLKKKVLCSPHGKKTICLWTKVLHRNIDGTITNRKKSPIIPRITICLKLLKYMKK